MIAQAVSIPLRTRGSVRSAVGTTIGGTARPTVVTFQIAVHTAYTAAHIVTAGDLFHLLVGQHFLYAAQL